MKLTNGERLLILRRRQGRSQIEAAKNIGVTLYNYRAFEADKTTTREGLPVGRLANHERCFLLRKRAGLSQQKLAARLGITPTWLVEIEHGRQSIAKLAAYWWRRG